MLIVGTIRMHLTLIDSAAVGGFAIALLCQLWVSSVPSSRIFNKWLLLLSAVAFAVLSFLAFGLLYKETDPLLEHVADLDRLLTNVSDISECKQVNNIKVQLDDLVTPHVKILLDMAQPLIERHYQILGVVAVGITVILLMAVLSVFFPPPQVGTATASRLILIFTTAALVAITIYAVLVDMLLSYKSEVDTGISKTKDIKPYCKNESEIEKIISIF